MKKINLICFFILLTGSQINPVLAQQKNDKLPKLLIRLDDIGMNHSVNMAMQKMAETGFPISASVQFACPWYQEAVDILRRNPQITVGVHLTLTSEWKY